MWNCDAKLLGQVTEAGLGYRSFVKVPMLVVVAELACLNAIGYASLKLFMELYRVE